MAKPTLCLSEGCFCPKDPRAEVSPSRVQCHNSPVLLPGPSTSSQPPPVPFPSAPEATESKEVSKIGAILHSSRLVFFPSVLSLSFPLFPCLRAGKTTPACLQGRNVLPDIVSSTHTTLGCFLAAQGGLLTTGTLALINA